MNSNSRKLKICIASQAPFLGGAEVAAERLALGLQHAGHEAFVVLGQSGVVMDRMRGVGLRCIEKEMRFTDRWHWLQYYRSRRALRTLLLAEKPDILHNNDLNTHHIMSGAAMGLPMPRICHHRFPFSGEVGIDWFNKFGAERHFFVSAALMAEMCAVSKRLRDSSRTVLYDGLPMPPRPTSEDRRAARRQLSLSPNRVIVTFAGQIIERKGVADLLNAWALLDASLKARTDLIIVGDDLKGEGAYRMAMEKLADQLGVPARFAGFQKNVGEWLIAADIATVPSHVEPLGNATLEAMAYELPVIGCSVGGIPEMVVHEKTGLLVPPHAPDRIAAALALLISNADVRCKYAEAGRRRSEEKFSLPAHISAVLDEYRRLLSSNCESTGSGETTG